MRDFFLRIGNSSNYSPLDREFYSLDQFKEVEVSYENFQFYGIYSKELSNELVLENEEIFVTVYGKVFPRFYIDEFGTSFLSAKKVYNLICRDENYYDEIKGNFLVIIFEKKNNRLKVVSDQLGIRPVYYGKLSGDFIVTSNLFYLKNYDIKKNRRVFLESVLFSYPISDETFVKDMLYFDSGTELIFENNTQTVNKIYKIDEVVFSEKLEKFETRKFVEIFNDSVLKKASVSKNILVSLTGGFDGRSIVSTLLKKRLKFRSYSFGKKNGENTEIPLLIKEKIGVDYTPVYLEKDYEKHYAEFAQKAILYSDGQSIFERANYPFAFSRLNDYSDYVLTGLVGGEIFGTVHQKTDYINQLYYDTVYENKSIPIAQYLNDNHIHQYINHSLVDKYLDEIKSIVAIKRERIEKHKQYKNGYLSYLYDLINTGFKRFYGSEMHTVRFYVENLTPMYDIDILEYFFKTRHKDKYRNAFKKSLFLRRKNRILQAKIIKRNYPELTKIKVDRNFTPNELLNPFKSITIPLKFFIRRKRVENSPKEFTSDKWSSILFNYIKDNLILIDEELLSPGHTKQYIEDYEPDKYNKELNRLISLSVFSKRLFGNK